MFRDKVESDGIPEVENHYSEKDTTIVHSPSASSSHSLLLRFRL